MHEVHTAKKRKASELKWGQRQFRRVTAGYKVTRKGLYLPETNQLKN